MSARRAEHEKNGWSMLNYSELLNQAQYEVVSAPYGPMLVIAGAGTGKTRTIVYRLAWLTEHGVDPRNILLLTFTRKAAREMLDRAADLLGADLRGLYGGTFHAFAYRMLRQFRPAWLQGRQFSVLDSTDQQEIVRRCKDDAGVSKGVRGFPKVQAIVGMISRARNKEVPLKDILATDSPQLMHFARELETVAQRYAEYKRSNGLLDYDDLLFELEDLLRTDQALRYTLQDMYRHILVDEYQDTNLVQARILQLLAGRLEDDRSVMAVGDEAQSIYAFRGATVRNILDFPKIFPGTRIVALEENYRSVQPVLEVANAVMSHAKEGYEKTLSAFREGGDPVRIVECHSDGDQARCVASRIKTLLKSVPPTEIAVLFRSGYQSYQLEAELAARSISCRKYGGLRFQEAAHVKDLMAYLHLVVNPDDLPAFTRIACMQPRIGAKTAEKILHARGTKAEARHRKSYPDLFRELDELAAMREAALSPEASVEQVMVLYQPHLEELYPEDYHRRSLGLNEIKTLAARSEDLELFLAELLLDSVDREEKNEKDVVLSTIHSAKGLEWKYVFVIDLVDGKLPSRFALARGDAMEEERRLMYVACTRARDNLELYWYHQSESQAAYGGDSFCVMSTFLEEMMDADVDTVVGTPSGRQLQKRAAGASSARKKTGSASVPASASEEFHRQLQELMRDYKGRQSGEDAAEDDRQAHAEPASDTQTDSQAGTLVPATELMDDIRAGRITTCQHRMFGEGRILSAQEGSQLLKISFPVLGVKNIIASYVFVKK